MWAALGHVKSQLDERRAVQVAVRCRHARRRGKARRSLACRGVKHGAGTSLQPRVPESASTLHQVHVPATLPPHSRRPTTPCLLPCSWGSGFLRVVLQQVVCQELHRVVWALFAQRLQALHEHRDHGRLLHATAGPGRVRRRPAALAAGSLRWLTSQQAPASQGNQRATHHVLSDRQGLRICLLLYVDCRLGRSLGLQGNAGWMSADAGVAARDRGPCRSGFWRQERGPSAVPATALIAQRTASLHGRLTAAPRQEQTARLRFALLRRRLRPIREHVSRRSEHQHTTAPPSARGSPGERSMPNVLAARRPAKQPPPRSMWAQNT